MLRDDKAYVHGHSLGMRGSRKCFQRGSNFDRFLLLVDEGIQVILKADHHWPASETPFDGPTLNNGLVALCFFRGSRPVLLRNPIFYDFSEGGPEF